MKARWMIAALFVVLLVILLGCTSGTVDQDGQQTADATSTSEAVEESTPLPEEPPETCTAQWTCFDEEHRVYQYANCTKVNKQQCSYGCVNGNCAEPSCEAGWKCRGDYRRGYYTNKCEWTQVEDCELGCADGNCSEAPAETTADAEEEEEVEDAYLNPGETHAIDADGTTYSLRIYIMDTGRVRFEVNGDRTNWIEAGEKLTYQDLTINVVSIAFQPGGVQEVEYTVG